MDFLRQWIGIILILAGLARAGVLVLQEPMVGYANQGDMHATSACTGLFPADPAAAQAPTPAAPVSTYTLGSRTDGCYQSAEVGIAATAVAIARATGSTERFKLQRVGYVKLALLFGAALAIAWLLRDHPAAATIHGLVVLLVLSDPVVTLWMNTLYTEFATIWSIYLVIAASCVLALYDRQSLLAWGLLIVGLLVLAVSSEQYALLGPAMVLAAWPWLWHSSHRLTVATLVIALVAAFVGLVVLPRPAQLARVDRTNAYLGLLAPASSSATRALATLQLPDACEPLVGASWSRQRGESVDKACPQVYALSRFAFLRMASDEPAALGRAGARALPAMQGVSPAYLGTQQGQRGKVLADLPWWAFSPIGALDAALPASVFAALTIATFVLAPAGLVALLVLRRWRGDPLAPLLLAMLLGGSALYAFASTILLRGLDEGARHYLVGSLATYVVLIMAVGGLGVLAMRWKETPKEAMLELATGVAVIGLAAFASFAAIEWMGAQAAATGALEQPPGRQVSAAGIQVRGWALAASGVDSVKVRVGSIERTAQLGDAGPGGRVPYTLDLTREDLAQGGAPNPLTLRVFVHGKNGAIGEIDRRNLEFAPAT